MDHRKKGLLLKVLTLFGIVLMPLFLLVSHYQDQAKADSQSKVIITVNTLNVRSLPGLDGNIVSEVHKGEIYEVMATDHNWDQIKLTDNQMGWVYADYVHSTTDSVLMGVASTVNGLNVHESASLNAQIISHLSTGTLYPLLDQKGSFVEVQSSDGPGWVSTQFVTEKQIGHTIQTETATVTAHALTIHQMSSVSSQITGYLAHNDVVFIKAEQSGWAWIRTESGQTGWVSEHYLNIEPQSTAAGSVQHTTAPVSNSSSVTSPPSQSKTIRVASESVNSANNVLMGKTIVLDPGHGGIDNGTTGVDGTPEKVLTLQTAEEVKSKLEAAGAHVIMTRETDTYVTLQDRADLSNQSSADAFISFHYNASPLTFIKGLTDFYYNKSRDGRLASDVLNGVVQSTGLTTRGTRFENLYVLRNNTQPSTLIELGFISNKSEDTAVHNAAYQAEVADGVYQGLINYFSNN